MMNTQEYPIDAIPEGVILPSNDRAKPHPIEAWIDARGRKWFDESTARQQGATHKSCSGCDQYVVPRDWYGRCRSCRGTRAMKDWEEAKARGFEPWDGVTPLCEHDGDRYIFDEDDLIDYLADLPEGAEPMLVKCRRDTWRMLDPANIVDSVECDDPYAVELPKGVEALIEQINTILREHPPAVWIPAHPHVAVDVSAYMPPGDAA